MTSAARLPTSRRKALVVLLAFNRLLSGSAQQLESWAGPGPGGRHDGACRVGTTHGDYKEWARWGKTEAECQNECKRDAKCVAYEFFSVGGYVRCEMHYRKVTHLLPTISGAVCKLKPRADASQSWKQPGPLNGEKCRAMLADPSFLFRRMWAAEAWGTMDHGRPACWNRERDHKWQWQHTDAFFNEATSGEHCWSNWYEGNGGDLGRQDRIPHFDAPAPALLGFDEDIDGYCALQFPLGDPRGRLQHAVRCVEGNLNILSLYGDRVPYNLCRNLEWQVCAAKGLLPGQRSEAIKFARPPNTLDPTGATSGKPLGKCQGWVPDQVPAGDVYGYATDDIYYLEVCIFNQICNNGDDVFSLRAGQDFYCDYSERGFNDLKRMLLEPAAPPGPDARECHHAIFNPSG